MAVYTEVGTDELAAFLGLYDLGELLSCKGIAEGVENTNYAIHTTAGYFILTLYEKRVDPGDLPFFIALMEHLADRGLTCPLPVKTRAGSALGTLAGRPAAIVTLPRRHVGAPAKRRALRRGRRGAGPASPRRRRLPDDAAPMRCRWPAGGRWPSAPAIAPTPWRRGSAR